MRISVLTLLFVLRSLTALAGDTPDYQRDIRPILTEHCFQCHGPDSGKRQAGLRLDERDRAIAQLESGATAIRPGSANASELVRRIETMDPDVIMPPPKTKRQLTAEQKELLRRWIEAGASYSEHWAYRKPSRPMLPVTQDQSWSRNAIDRFVLAQLEAAGLRPSPEADRTTLIRRLFLDLTGLPPSIEEVDQFIADPAPDSYERLVDRVLASPHFGERMAQDWLDLARFGDSSGYQDDGDRPNFPYRDYVISAFNANMPFDQFTIENLAGDLLPNATLMQKVASGFNRLHRHNEEGGSDPDEFQVVYAVDRTNTTATTWMGLTFGCAQCHDHKYDPISQREFYQLYAFFNSLKGEAVISKAASPPQIRVPDSEQQRRLDQLSRDMVGSEQRQRELQSTITAAFTTWLKEQQGSTAATSPPAKTGAAGGSIARSSHSAWYGDIRLDKPLTFDKRLSANGRVAVVRSVNNIADVGHFLTKDIKSGSSVGFMVAEGPRFFACLGLPDGTRIVSDPIAGEHGVDYSWSYDYDPVGGNDDSADPDNVGEGLLTFEIRRAGVSAGVKTIDFTAAQRAVAASLDAFGISFRGASDADSPIDFFIDDVEYTISGVGMTRGQNFDRDPEWVAFGNLANGHRFGFDSAVTVGGSGLSVEQILALPADKRSPQDIDRLREHFIAERFPELRALETKLAAIRRDREAIEKSVALAYVWEEMESPRPSRILIRGDYQLPGDTVERNVPAMFPPLSAEGPRDRLALARWLVNGEHPLTARVVVNRLWKQCFGAGLVRTSEDFGVRGEPPTHPDLLDWLATEFSLFPANHVSSSGSSANWDTKRLLRFIVTSSTYRQSSAVTPQLQELDPGNRLLAREARFRLSAEEIRDGALTMAGLLTRHVGGRSVYPYQPDHFYRDKEDDPGEWKWPLESGSNLYRRGIYTFLRRTTPYPVYQTFDAPSRGECTVARSRTNTPLQAMVTLNDPVFVEAARVLGERIAMHDVDHDGRLTFAFRTVLLRYPTIREKEVIDSLFRSSRDRYVADPQAAAALISQGKAPRQSNADLVQVAAWTAVATTLLNLDEAMTRE